MRKKTNVLKDLSTQLAVIYKPVNDLRPYANNARTHSDEQIAQIAQSIARFGFTNPILADPENGVIAGHGRLLAAKKLGLADVPVIELRDLTHAQKAAYVIADNKLALNAGWSVEMLRLEMAQISELGEDLELTGFSEDEIAKLMGDKQGLTEPDAIPENVPPVAKLGDLWELGNHRLICGDSTQQNVVSRLLGLVKPHLMVTDPPYGVEYDPKWRAGAGINKNHQKMGVVANDGNANWREAWALFPGVVAYVWHAGRYASEVQKSLEDCGLIVRCQIVWAKDRFALSRGDYHWQHEPCWYVVRKGATGSWNGDRKQSTLWEIKAREDGGHGHSTQKPVECMKRPILNNSSIGQAVYEPFSGSGTTLIAAEMTGRHCYAIEINPAYLDIAIKRWENFTGEKAKLIDGSTEESARLQIGQAMA